MGRMIYGALTVLLLMAAGCGERNSGSTDVALGPEETVEAFCRAVAGSDFEKAMSLCDTTTMKGYIRQYAQAWDMMARTDSGATAIAAASLADAEFIVEDIARDGDKRTVTYTIAAGKDMNKKKTAVVRKEEGAWKVEKITDSL